MACACVHAFIHAYKPENVDPTIRVKTIGLVRVHSFGSSLVLAGDVRKADLYLGNSVPFTEFQKFFFGWCLHDPLGNSEGL